MENAFSLVSYIDIRNKINRVLLLRPLQQTIWLKLLNFDRENLTNQICAKFHNIEIITLFH